MTSKLEASADAMIRQYLSDFSSLRSDKCCLYWHYPSALVCNDKSSKLFKNSTECKDYYTILFLSLRTKNYKMTKIDSLLMTQISEKIVIANLHARRVENDNSLIQKLNCIYTIAFNDDSNSKIKVATCF